MDKYRSGDRALIIIELVPSTFVQTRDTISWYGKGHMTDDDWDIREIIWDSHEWMVWVLPSLIPPPHARGEVAP